MTTTQPIDYPVPPMEPSARAGGSGSGSQEVGSGPEPGGTTPAGAAGGAPAGLVPARRRQRGLGGLVLVVALAALLVAAPVVVLIAGLGAVRDAFAAVNPFDGQAGGQTTVDRSGEPVLMAITDLGEYRAASAYYELVIDVERDVEPLPSFLAGERVLFVAAGSVDATVDFTDLEDAAVTVDEDRTSARLVLPTPELAEPAIDLERSYVYSRNRGLADRLTGLVREGPNDEQELYLLAEDRFAEAAGDNDELRSRAEANTRDMLVGLLGSLGFTVVDVEFVDGAAGPAIERPVGGDVESDGGSRDGSDGDRDRDG